MAKSVLRVFSILSIGILFWGCGPTEADKARMAELAKVEKIALVTFIGRSKTSPNHTTHHRLTQEMWEAFQARAQANTSVVRFIPNENVVRSEAYRQVATIDLPGDAFSPIPGLTYIKYGTEGGFDAGPVISALEADALFLVVAFFGNAIRQNGSAPYLNVEIYSGLVTPPENLVWERGWKSKHSALQIEEQILISVFDHPKLMGSIGAKWVLMQHPSEDEYDQLTNIAIEQKTKLPKNAGERLFDALVGSIEEARRAVSEAP